VIYCTCCSILEMFQKYEVMSTLAGMDGGLKETFTRRRSCLGSNFSMPSIPCAYSPHIIANQRMRQGIHKADDEYSVFPTDLFSPASGSVWHSCGSCHSFVTFGPETVVENPPVVAFYFHLRITTFLSSYSIASQMP
jgi:hypothetical protein